MIIRKNRLVITPPRRRWTPLHKGVLLIFMLLMAFILYRYSRPPEYRAYGTHHDRWADPALVDRLGHIPHEYKTGLELFEEHCSGCHGKWGEGSKTGPPLIHFYYTSKRVSDADIHRAIRSGVPAHHWGFGRMPPITDIPTGKVRDVIGFVRWLQRENGIH